MSAFPDDPEHFLRWLRDRPAEVAAFGLGAPQAGDFLPRRLYGRYLMHLVTEAARSSQRLHLVNAEAVDLEWKLADGFRLTLADGTIIRAKTVVLAMGNFPAAQPPGLDPALLGNPRYLASPWVAKAAALLVDADETLILGTGLTALDVLCTFQEANATGQVTLVSRHGLLPQSHRAMSPHGLTFAWNPRPRTVREAMHRIRLEIARATANGVDWRAVIDSLRADTSAIWQGWNEAERTRFLHHARAYWEVARHRAAPEAFAALEALRRDGRLTVRRGRVERLSLQRDAVEVVLVGGRNARKEMHASVVVNCLGPQTDLRRVDAPLITRLLTRGLVQPDAHGLGLCVTAEGQALDVHHRTDAPLYAMGALRKGMLWETTAVPELRAQAAALAATLAAGWKSSDATSVGFHKLPSLESIWAYEI
jgi:uncharacterized NAD(P)/FAD-binding protein YdhS